MSQSTCDVDPEVLQKLRKFRFSKRSQKGSAAFVHELMLDGLFCFQVKIDRERLCIVEDEVHDEITIEDLVEELPETSPRYIVLSYELTHNDGRKSYPLVLIYYAPVSTKPELHMLYASAKTYFQQRADINKVFDIREAETLSDEWLQEKLLS
ncbi:3077_t:CDS:2 [Paraglomus brasilianum]|uniref:3077_t:CDS:1 n=1 Tax=Paraglomus brasilianum TaxID=144538 RepID=A0A9N8WQ47_9GLOM|nr:3077_t:CDS:2 [Paraglomus brasilianum]